MGKFRLIDDPNRQSIRALAGSKRYALISYVPMPSGGGWEIYNFKIEIQQSWIDAFNNSNSYQFAAGVVSQINTDNNQLTLSSAYGGWGANQIAYGPDTTPATGTVASTNPASNTMTLSVSDETFPKRWIVNQGKFVKGEETPSMDSAPDLEGLTIYSSDFKSDPDGALSHTDSDWQITLKTDLIYANPVDQATQDGTNLTSWPPTGLEGDTAYRCRVRHRSGAIKSDWSDDVTFKTAEESTDANATLPPGRLYIASTQSADAPGIPLLTPAPSNTDGTNYIDIVSCADLIPTLALDTNNNLWVFDNSGNAPKKANPQGATGKIIKIAGGQNPSQQANCLALTDSGEVWRGWSLQGTVAWAETSLPFPNSEVISMFSMAYCDSLGFLLERDNVGTIEWWSVPANTQALGTPARIGPDNAKQVIFVSPWDKVGYIWINENGTLGGTVAPTDTSTKFKKLIAAGYDSYTVIGITENGEAKYVYQRTGSAPLPDGETGFKDLIVPATNSYASRFFALGQSGKVYISPERMDSGSLASVTWYEMTDLKDKYKTFGVLSSQAPIVIDRINLLIPD